MTVTFDLNDILLFLKYLKKVWEIDTSLALTALDGNASFGPKGLTVKKKLSVGSGSVCLAISPTPEGSIALSIVSVAFSGVPLAWILRPKARGMILEALSGYSKYVDVTSEGGNIILTRTPLHFTAASSGSLGINVSYDLE